MSLETLPREVLAQIFYGPHRSFLAISLWKCGSRVLNGKLVVSLECVDLKDDRAYSTSRYPKMVSELKSLRSLTLSRGKWSLMESATSLNREIRKISSPNLRSLEIVSAEATESFFNFSPSSSDPEAASNGAMVPAITRRKGTSRFYDIGAQFPNLEALTMHKGDEDGSHHSLTFDDLVGLPDTLKVLKLPQMTIVDRMQRVLSLLPRSLELWDIAIEVEGNEFPTDTTPTIVAPQFWADPPPNLHTIRRIVDYSTPITLEFLPRTMTQCNIITNHLWLPIEVLRTMPPNFVRLNNSSIDIGDIKDYGASRLPQRIQELSLTNYRPQHLGNLLPTLPSTLHTLSIHSDDDYESAWDSFWASGEASMDRHFWPSHLTSLTIKQTCTLQQLGTLPAALKTLNIALSNSEEINFQALPRALSKLTIVFSETIDKVQIGPGLPNLTSLALGAGAYNQHLAPQIWVNLPATLIHLDLLHTRPFDYSSAEDTTPSISLPNGIETFITGFWSTYNFEYLPSSLTRLRVTMLQYGNGYTQKIDDTADYFACLPVSLKSLFLGPTNTGGFVPTTMDTLFSHLINLEELHLGALATFPASILQHLNAGLRVIRLTLANFTEKDVPFLNPNWREMQLRLKQPDPLGNVQYQLMAKHWPVPAIHSVMEGHIGRDAISILRSRLDAIRSASFRYPAIQTTF